MDPTWQLALTVVSLTLLFGSMALSGLIVGRRMLAGAAKHLAHTKLDVLFPLKGRWLRYGLAGFFFALSLFGFAGLFALAMPLFGQHRY
jgi:hypothetical protein